VPSLTDKALSVFAQDIVRTFLGFISIIAVIYIIYAGFQLMTSGGDEEKTKKAKNIILYIILGIIIMWLSYSIVNWTIRLLGYSATWNTISYNWLSIPEANANNAYTESEINTFIEYKNKIIEAIQIIEWDLKVNKSTSISNLQNLKNLVQYAFERLPDSWAAGTENSTAKRSVDIDIAIAMKNPDSISDVGTALSKVSSFINSVKIDTITWDISADPSEWNAPITVSFRANNVKDPSWTNPDSQNYIWWMRWNGWKRIEIGRWASLTYTFTQEGTFTVSLDVVSSSRNSKWNIDVLPLTASKQIEVKPKLGEIVLLVNGVNVSNLSSLKISPNIGKMGILFDATASRAVWNGSITSTSWDFWNDQTMNYKWSPIVERQLYVNEWTYPVKLTVKTNSDYTFSKEINLIIRDPSAVIKADNTVWHVGEEMNFQAFSYFTTQSNVEYAWQIQDDNNKKVFKSWVWPTLTYKFPTIGSYIVTLTSRSPNGNIDTDSRIITIESREPVINLAMPISQSNEKPNVILFDASKSYDPDTMSRKWLIFTWRLNGEKIILDNQKQDGSIWNLKFDSVWTHTISLTVSNAYGKIATTEKTFDVTSILSVNLIATPSVAPLGTTMNFIGQSENAWFYEWDMGDGTTPINGSKKLVQHIYKKTWVYTVTLTVKSKDWTSRNQISKTVYATDTNTPFAAFSGKNGSNSIYEDATACNNSWAIIINRSEPTSFDATESINIDWSTAWLTYTWEYFGKVKTTEYFSEKFSDLGCFPIKLTVRSNANWATHSTTRYISLRNQVPELTSLTTSIDSTKKDSQKVLVKVTANWATDPDWVITSYIWYYTTESDKEPQNVQITQKNEITFVLPNITEKYYFWVILEDNDGGRMSSIDNSVEQTPLIIDNQEGNIYLPLISLSSPKIWLAGERIRMTVDAKTIVWTNITNKAEYAWDFDGDGKIDEKSPNPTIEHIYKSSWTYSLKVRVTYNGVSNTKYQTITIKNPLKANFFWYKFQNWDIYFLNASKGPYEKVIWDINWLEPTESLYSLRLSSTQVPSGPDLWKLTITSADNDTANVAITMKDVRDISSSGNFIYQSFPFAIDNTIRVSWPWEKVLISLIGNNATRYLIDDDLSVDSDLDWVTDNDADNKNTPSYTDWSVYSIQEFSTTWNKRREIRLSLYNWNTLIHSEKLTIVFDYIKESSVSGEALLSLDDGSLSSFDKKELDVLSGLIRATDDINRIILMQMYNLLIENWGDPFSKAKTLIDIQEKVWELNLPAESQAAFSKSVDALLVGDSESTDEITIAAKLIEWLIPETSENRTSVLEKLTAIKSHPQLISENKVLAKDILKLIENDSSIESKYKLHIKNQLQIIVNGWQGDVTEGATTTEPSVTTSWGILWFVGGVVKIFFLIIGILIVVIFIGYIFYRISRKNSDIGFQDFLIDSVFHTKWKWAQKSWDMSDSIQTIQKSTPTVIPNIDPLTASYSPVSNDPLNSIESRNESISIESTPSLEESSPTLQYNEPSQEVPKDNDETGLIQEDVQVPEWLKATKIDAWSTDTPTELPQESIETSVEMHSDWSWEELITNTDTEISEIDTPEPPMTYVAPVVEVEEESPEDVLLVREDREWVSDSVNTLQDSTEARSIIENQSFTTTIENTQDDSTGFKLPTPIEREDNMPDWLSIDPIVPMETEKEVAIVSETDSTTITSPDDIIPTKEVKSENTAEDILPDWLIQSVKSWDTSKENTSEESLNQSDSAGWIFDMIETKSPENKVKEDVKKVNKGKKTKKEEKPSLWHDNIPDWLK
jgi:PKD repeat protein/type IV secretory pathway VirB2 component (pilin)